MNINIIEEWFTPTDNIRKLPGFNCEMSRQDHGFLSGIIKLIKPKKILEVGVAQGGTTAVVIKSLEMLGYKSDFFSVDIAETYKGKEIGCFLNSITYPDNVRHILFLKRLLIDCIEEIGDGIDLAIIDTQHIMPGEILEFLTLLPYMSKNGMIILHDVDLPNHFIKIPKHSLMSLSINATKILFTTVTGDKFYNRKGDTLPNIGAFRINDDTITNIDDVFYSLSHIWMSSLSERLITKYRLMFEKSFSEQNVSLFNLISRDQINTTENINLIGQYINLYQIIHNPFKAIIRIYKKLKFRF